jgi:MSHA biogenesis protein MshN
VSLINKMLQDLDARHTAASEAAHLYTKPVARRDARIGLPVMIAAVVGAAVLAAAGSYGWHYWQAKHQSAPVPHPAKAVGSGGVVTTIVTAPTNGPAAQPARVVTQDVVPAPAASQAAAKTTAMREPAASTVTRPQTAATTVAKPEPKSTAGKAVAPVPAAPHDIAVRERTTVAGKPARLADSAAGHKGRHELRNAETKRIAAKLKAEGEGAVESAPARKAETIAKASGQGKEETAAQKAEAAYRRALTSMQEGYVNDAIDGFGQALKANPHHDAARQTLVSLLIENGRAEEAMRQLQLSLTLDPRQPSMAMLLARLQIEHGASGIDTLTRTLPYAGSDGEYRAFLAGALERQQRHREAAEQYQAALREAPQNGVWWMGLGIALQADKRNGEAIDAFRKARGTGLLKPELLSFVENKIQQLSR